MKNAMSQADSVQQIVDELRAEIVSGTLPPGAFLAQETLAARFNISRMPIREVIKQLQSLGFVTVQENKRAHVAAMSQADFLEIYDMRIAVETLAIRSAIPQLTNAQIDSALAVQREIEQAPHDRFGALNTRFHMLLYAPSQRHRLLDLIENLGQAADRYSFMCEVEQDFRDKSNQEHHELLKCCRDRDETAAADCLETHVRDARDLFVTMFQT